MPPYSLNRAEADAGIQEGQDRHESGDHFTNALIHKARIGGFFCGYAKTFALGVPGSIAASKGASTYITTQMLCIAAYGGI